MPLARVRQVAPVLAVEEPRVHVHAALVAAAARHTTRLPLHAPLVAVVQFFQRALVRIQGREDLDPDEPAGAHPPQTKLRDARRRHAVGLDRVEEVALT